MKTSVTRLLVIAFAVATLGGMSVAPKLSYGLNVNESDASGAQERVQAQKAYQEAYQRSYDATKEAELKRLEGDGEKKEEGGCCGGS